MKNHYNIQDALFDTYLHAVCNTIRNARLACGLTQTKAAKNIGLSLRYLQDIERGRRNPTLRVIYDIARVYGVGVPALVDGAGQGVPQTVEPVPAPQELQGGDTANPDSSMGGEANMDQPAKA